MPTLADAATRAEIVARITALTPDRVPAWGRMTAPQMLAHCADAMRMAYGELPCASKGSPVLRFPLVKWLILEVLPFPKGAPTARELLSRPPAVWGDERDAVVALVERFAQEQSRPTWPEHPAFGALTGKQWGGLTWKHLDHHLRQFHA